MRGHSQVSLNKNKPASNSEENETEFNDHRSFLPVNPPDKLQHLSVKRFIMDRLLTHLIETYF